MRILFVSYPMLPVSDTSCGGAEQMLWTLEREVARRGHRTAVAACQGSQVSGELIPTGDVPEVSDAFGERAEEHCAAVIEAAREGNFDLLHDKSGFFWQHAAEVDTPVLATLHLPRSFYDAPLFGNVPGNVSFNCVSNSQAETFRDLGALAGVVPNGIALECFRYEPRKRGHVLWVGRICPEKAPHLAMDAAARAGVPLILMGSVYPFSYHEAYFEREVRPRLERMRDRVQWIDGPTFEEKVQAMSTARALLLPTQAPETSSLVSMEAMACGTPVIAFPKGAVPEIVEHGVTGFLVEDVREMALAVADVDLLWPQDMQAVAQSRFSAHTMADGYEYLYAQIAGRERESLPLAA